MKLLFLIAMLAVVLNAEVSNITNNSDVTCNKNSSILYNIAIFLLHIPLTKDMSFQDRMLFSLKRKKTGKSCTELIQFSKVTN